MIEIRAIAEEEIDQVLALEAKSAPKFPIYYPWDKEELVGKIILNNTGGRAFGAFDGEKLVGWSAYRDEGDGVYQLCGMVVDTEYRRQGIGTRLLEVRLDDLKSKSGVKKIYSTNYPKNTPIIVLLLQHGFVIEDFKKDYYGPGADRVFTVYQK